MTYVQEIPRYVHDSIISLNWCPASIITCSGCDAKLTDSSSFCRVSLVSVAGSGWLTAPVKASSSFSSIVRTFSVGPVGGSVVVIFTVGFGVVVVVVVDLVVVGAEVVVGGAVVVGAVVVVGGGVVGASVAVSLSSFLYLDVQYR